MIKSILAWDKNKLIGKNNKLPWHIPEELNFFKQKTMNNYLLMGKKTFLSLPKKLEGRKIIVLSKNEKKLGYKTINNFQYIIKYFQSSNKDIYISGGKSIYEKFYKYSDEIYISEINQSFEGNIYLNINLEKYRKKIYKTFEKFIVYKYTKIIN